VEWLITNSVAAWLLPPGCLLLLATVGAFMARRRPRAGRALVALSLAVLYALSTPFAGGALIRMLEPAQRDPIGNAGGQAIVVLGGGTYFAAPEYGRNTVSGATLVRLRYTAHLRRALKRPVMVTGGAPQVDGVAEAELMKQVLEGELGTPVQWIEKRSRNTLENARLARRMLAPTGVNTVYLVTHAWHLPRARLAFERSGFTVIPAATSYATRNRLTLLDFMPAASALLDSSLFFREVIGIGWYHLRLLTKS